MIRLNGEEGGGSALKDLRMDSSGFLSFLCERDKSSRMIDVSSKKCRQVHTQNSHTLYDFFKLFLQFRCPPRSLSICLSFLRNLCPPSPPDYSTMRKAMKERKSLRKRPLTWTEECPGKKTTRKDYVQSAAYLTKFLE